MDAKFRGGAYPRWVEPEQPRPFRRGGAEPALVPVDSSSPLQEQVNRGEVAQHQVEVEIEALLHYLSRDEDGARGAAPSLPKALEGGSLSFEAPGRRILSMQQQDFGVRLREGTLGRAVGLLGPSDGVANPGGASTEFEFP